MDSPATPEKGTDAADAAGPADGVRHAMRLRPATPGDLAAIDRLNAAAVPAVNDIGVPGFDDFAVTAPYFRVVDDSRNGPAPQILAFLVGLDERNTEYASLNFAFFAARYDRFAYVDRIVVAETARGQGVGSRLYADFEAWAATSGAPLVACEVNIRPRNDVSLAFHAARGYRSVGEQDTEGGSKRVSLLTKVLNGSHTRG